MMHIVKKNFIYFFLLMMTTTISSSLMAQQGNQPLKGKKDCLFTEDGKGTIRC